MGTKYLLSGLSKICNNLRNNFSISYIEIFLLKRIQRDFLSLIR